MNVYGTPPRCIPLDVAAAAAEMTRDELIAALGGNCIKVGPNKLGVTPAALEAVSEGASEGLQTYTPNVDLAAQGLKAW